VPERAETKYYISWGGEKKGKKQQQENRRKKLEKEAR